MNSKKLIILDINQNIVINEKNFKYIYLSAGKVSLNNKNRIFIKKFEIKYYQYFKKKLIKKLLQNINLKENNLLLESEVFNLRNDKINFFNKIINILIIKKIFVKKNYDIKLITDNYFLSKALQKNKYFNVEYYNSENKKFNFAIIKLLKFYVKSLILVFFLKLFTKTRAVDKFKNMCLSLFPVFYIKKKEIFFNNKSYLKLNFLLTDETHNGFKLKQLLKFNRYVQNDETIYAERFINIKDILINIINLPFLYNNKLLKFNNKIIISGLDFTIFFESYLKSSFINRLKLEIYNKSLKRVLHKFSKIENFHYYLFEYSFGFYLTSFMKKNLEKLKLFGYQHGIFSNNLMWLDLIMQSKYKEMYIPTQILSNNIYSQNEYRKQIGNTKKIIIKEKKISNFAKDCTILKGQNSKIKKILVFAGTHDIAEIFYLLANKYNKNKNVVFFFKLHPKNNFEIKQKNNIKIITNVKKLKFHEVIISPTSSLIYDFIQLKKSFKIIDIDYKKKIDFSKIKKIQYFEI